MKTQLTTAFLTLATLAGFISNETAIGGTPPKAAEIKDIKAYCIDFNWAATGRKRLPRVAIAARGGHASASTTLNMIVSTL